MAHTEWLLVLCLGGAAACGGGRAPRGEEHPNVFLIYSDDQRFDGFSAGGNRWIETPALDRIADEGALFERSYVVCSRCCPGRATMLTGVYPTRHGVWSNHPEVDFPGERQTLADLFHAAGYRTAWIGKWHLPNPGARPVRGFDHFVSYEGPGHHFDQTLVIDGIPTPTHGFQADRLTDEVLRFLDEGDEKPFFLVLAFKNPHVPLTPAPRHAGLLDGVTLPVPTSAQDGDESLPAFYRGLRQDSRHELDRYQETARRYWELCLSIDDNVGRVLSRLEADGELDRTVVVFTTDNGQLLGEHGLSQKGLSYEPSIRVPLAIRYPPLIRPGTHSSALTLNVDLLPTLCELAGIEVPDGLDGRSLLPLMAGTDEGGPWRDAFLYTAPSFGEGAVVERALVEEDHKYVRIRIGERVEELLFDLCADPDERRNLAGDRGNAPILERMRAGLAAEREGLGDS